MRGESAALSTSWTQTWRGLGWGEEGGGVGGLAVGRVGSVSRVFAELHVKQKCPQNDLVNSSLLFFCCPPPR